MFNKSKDKCSLDKRLQTFHFESRLESVLHWQSIMMVVCTGGGGGGGGAIHCLLDSGLSIDAFLSCLEAWLLYMIYI